MLLSIHGVLILEACSDYCRRSHFSGARRYRATDITIRLDSVAVLVVTLSADVGA